MKNTVFLLVKVTVNTPFKNLQNAASELRRETELTITSTKNVEVLKAQLIDLKNK